MILMIDNFDSFTYNLVQYLGELKEELIVKRNNEITLDDIEKLKPDYIVISPGPCSPNEAGISLDVVKNLHHKVPILGVCLGHQSIGQAFGGEVVGAKVLMHGKTSLIKHDGKTLFKDLPEEFRVTRYHSLTVKKESLPKELMITATTDDGEIMAFRHEVFPVEGVQFHPESIMTQFGKEMLANFLKHYKGEAKW